MGISHYFYWLRTKFPECMVKVPRSTGYTVKFDNVLIDMNGIIHTATQKAFEYGKYAPRPRLLYGAQANNAKKPIKSQHSLEIEVYQNVCDIIDQWVSITKPAKRLILCIDGPAPMSKQNQQRQRRFRASMEATESTKFDSCNITPGTRFLHNLGKYVDWYIRKQLGSDEKWLNTEVIFSSAAVPGEGEAKCLNILRKIRDPNESYCIIGNDADLIMLALSANVPKIHVLREDMYNDELLYYVDVAIFSKMLFKEMAWISSETSEYSPSQVKFDFVFLCFFAGNDFLPHIPTIEIIQDGIELIFDIYKVVCSEYGHITYQANGKIYFEKSALAAFLMEIGKYEKSLIEKKLSQKEPYFPDELVNAASKQNPDGTWNTNIEKYIDIYWKSKFGDASYSTVCSEYLSGMQWVLTYYTTGVPSWKWFYPYHYAPPASVMAKYIGEFKQKKYTLSRPSLPFEQLLRVLPPKSAGLLPEQLGVLLTDPKSPLKKYFPEKIHIDLAGKRKEWEGKVIICNMDEKDMLKEYNARAPSLNKADMLRNIHEKSVIYIKTDEPQTYKHQYGDIKDCIVEPVEYEIY